MPITQCFLTSHELGNPSTRLDTRHTGGAATTTGELDIGYLGGTDLCHGRRDHISHTGDPRVEPMAGHTGPHTLGTTCSPGHQRTSRGPVGDGRLPWVSRAWATPFYHLVYDPDGRPIRMRMRRSY